jgi:steroid delta-isomerase
MPSPDEIRTAMQAYIEAMCASDIDAIMNLFAEDAWAEDPVGGEIQKGHEQLRVFYAGTAPSLQVELSGPIRVAGNECAMPMLAELSMGDQTLYIDVIDVMKFNDDGKVESMRAFWNPAEMRPTREA